MLLSLIRCPSKIRNIVKQVRNCHSVFGINNILREEKPENFTIAELTNNDHDVAMDIIKQFFLPEHVLVRSRNMDISNDQALDEYLFGLFRQGNSFLAKTEDDYVAGVCVNFASSPVDPRNLRHYAFYRQDPNIKDFLYFTAKMQETPNLWKIFNESQVFEMKMIAVLPEYRRLGLAVQLVERSKELAYEQGYNIIRMDCINQHDYKIAERSMLQCIVKFPLHKIRGPNAPFIKSSSDYNSIARVYVTTRAPVTEGNMADSELVIE